MQNISEYNIVKSCDDTNSYTLTQTVQCVTGKTRRNSTPIPKASQLNRLRWRIESCQGSSSEARDTLMCDKGKLWPSFSYVQESLTNFDILIILYCKAFQLVSLAVDWRDRSAACSVWLWPQWLLQGSHCQEVRTGQQFLFANLLNVVFFRYHSAKINVSFVKCQVKLVLQEKAFLANAYSMMGQCQGMVGKMKARQPNSSVTR